jgi:signal transduction histidine kinase
MIIKGRVDANATTDPLISQSLGMADKATHKLQATIVDLLEVARIEKRLQAEKDWISIFDVISGVLEDNQQQINQTETMFDIDLSAANELYFSKNNLSSILANLISNAIKYSSPDRDSMVKIYSHKKENGVVLVIEDNGIGMDIKKHEGNLFQMFKRFHDHVEGTGVGMYIVKKLMEDNGGSIELESEVNVGTKLTLYFQQPKTDPTLNKEDNLTSQV